MFFAVVSAGVNHWRGRLTESILLITGLLSWELVRDVACLSHALPGFPYSGKIQLCDLAKWRRAHTHSPTRSLLSVCSSLLGCLRLLTQEPELELRSHYLSLISEADSRGTGRGRDGGEGSKQAALNCTDRA